MPWEPEPQRQSPRGGRSVPTTAKRMRLRLPEQREWRGEDREAPGGRGAMSTFPGAEGPGPMDAFIPTETAAASPHSGCGPGDCSRAFPGGAPNGRPYCQWCQSCRC